jgi:hypothetical protein
MNPVSSVAAKPEVIDQLLRLVTDAERSKEFLKALKAATVEHRAAEQKAVQELRKLDVGRAEFETRVTKERRELEARETAWAAEEGRRRAAVEVLEKVAAEKDARASALEAQKTRELETVTKLRRELQSAVDKLAA